MKSSIFAALAVAALVPFAAAQRITGDSGCVTSCYRISVAVTQCSDLTDSGVISCICPNTTHVEQLNACQACISSLDGVSDLETNSINTLYTACSSNSTSSPAGAASSSAPPNTSASGTIGSNSAAQTSSNASGAGFHSVQAAGVFTVGVAMVAAFVTF